MKVLGIIGIICAGVVCIGIITLSRGGLFAKVTVTEKEVGPYTLVYAKHTGDYKNVGPLMDSLYYDLRDTFSLEATKGFGLYYDNPGEVSSEELRSIVGCIVDVDTSAATQRVGEKYGVAEYPAAQSVYAEFPFTGKMSIIMGVIKVYPKLSAYIEEQEYPKCPIMEIYDQPQKKLRYIASYTIEPDVFDSFLEENGQ